MIAPAYAPSWLDRLVAWLERLPGPTWIAYVVIGAGAIIVMHVQPWSLGELPVGAFGIQATYWGILTPALLWVAAYIQHVAGDSFDAFRPALKGSDAASDRLRYELVVLPATPSLVISIGAIVLTVASLTQVPESSGIVGMPGPAVAAVGLLQAFDTALLFLLVYRLIRQMRLVRRTPTHAALIDLFRPGPLHALANLTSRPGAALTLLVASSALISPLPTDFNTFLVGWAPYLLLPPVVAAIAFVGPLTGVHRELAAQKERLQDEAEMRLQGVLTELNRAVDGRDLPRADGLNKTLAGLLVQRDVLARLATWPWSGTTLRGFVSAIFLPLALSLAQQGLSRLL